MESYLQNNIAVIISLNVVKAYNPRHVHSAVNSSGHFSVGVELLDLNQCEDGIQNILYVI